MHYIFTTKTNSGPMEVPNISGKTHQFEISPTLVDLCHIYLLFSLVFSVYSLVFSSHSPVFPRIPRYFLVFPGISWPSPGGGCCSCSQGGRKASGSSQVFKV